MREIPVPASREEQQRALRGLKRKSTVFSVFFYISLALSVAGFLGAVVSVIVFELKNLQGILCYSLLGGFFGGAVLFGGLSYLFSRLFDGADLMRLDFAERCDSENSFYVGEGTLATFEETCLHLHGDTGETKNIRIPYAEIRVFSVCTRRAPKEKGEWSVVFELPARYLAKSGKAVKDEKVLVQADAKERLYRVIGERGLTLLGEDRTPRKNRRYVLKTKFFVPVPDKRRRALLMTVLGFLAAAAGIPTAIFWNVTVGSFLCVIGIFLGGRSLSSFLGAKSVFAVYEEGVYWRSAAGERIFLKWEELVSVSRTRADDRPVLQLKCIYGDYHLPDIAGAYEYVRDFRPDKCGEYGKGFSLHETEVENLLPLLGEVARKGRRG